MDVQAASDRFWSRVAIIEDETSCWIYEGPAVETPSGHLRLNWCGAKTYAHRVSFFTVHDHWPTPLCRHHCDVPQCVRPTHLAEGDAKANARDRDSRGRRRPLKGTASPCSKLTDRDVAELLEAREMQVSMAALVMEYGVSRSTIYSAWRRADVEHAAAA